MRPAEARRALDERVVARLERPVSVRVAERRYGLGAERAAVRVDVERTLTEALALSRRGSAATRLLRELRGR